ncbi:MAG: hypothetical protein Q8P57_00100 [Candidatus Pacearchaeota archaeon]|nr:hypothetical protein [Candidatus Pacearchaeota archaeon]
MFKQFLKEVKHGERVESELIKTLFYSLITSFLVLGFLWVIKLKNVDNFVSDYGFFLFFAVLSYAFLIPAIRQVRAYNEMPCMSGMMVGMTTGMIAGFLSGFFVASTNGMFVGSVFGMFIGITLGAWNGKCCGVMGFLEGIMAGFMGGLMGAMTAFMLFNDNLRPATIIVFIISAVILFSLNYMIYQDRREFKREKKEGHFLTILLALILVSLTTWIIVFGPRSGVFG